MDEKKHMKNLLIIAFFNLFIVFSVAADNLTYYEFNTKYEMASRLYKEKQYQSALKVMDELVADPLSEEYPSVFLSRSLTLYYLERYDESLKDIEICIQKEPYVLKPIYCRSVIYTALKNYDKALADIDYCLDRNPRWDDANHQKGLIYLNMKKYEEALEPFEKAINNSDEVKPNFYSDRGFAYYYLKDYHKAKRDFLFALKYTSDDDACLCLVDVCYKLNEFEEGMKYADILIKKGSRVNFAIIDKSYLLFALDRYDEAKEGLDSIFESSNNLSSYHKALSIYYILTDKFDSAIKEIDIAYSLNQKDNDILILKQLFQNGQFNMDIVKDSFMVEEF